MKRGVALILCLLCVVGLLSCSKGKKKDNVLNQELNINRVEDIDFDDSFEEKEIPMENPDMYSNTYMDVEPDFVFTLQNVSSYFSLTDVENNVEITPSLGDNVELHFSYRNDSEAILFDVSAVGGYEAGAAYTVSIEGNDLLLFYGKDASVRNIIFSIKDEDRNILETIEYDNYDLNKVTHFEGYGIYDTFLYYDGTINHSAGDIITFSNDDEKIYIEIIRIETSDGKTKIYYKCPDADKMFTAMDIHMDNKPADVENDFVLRDLEEIANEINESDLALIYCYAVADKYDFLPQLADFRDSVSINVSFKPSGNKFELGIEISYTNEAASGWRTCLSLRFKWTKSFTASGSAKIESVLGIPTGVSMNCSVASDESFTGQFLITRKNKKFKDDNQADTPKDLDFDRARQAVNDLRDRYYDLDKFGYKKDIVIGDTIMINIGHLSLYFGYLSIDIDVYACLKLQTDITVGASYTYSNHQVMVNYSSSNGNGDGGSSPSDVYAKTATAYLCGTLSVEAYLKIRVTAYITGMKYIANIGADADIGFYFDLNGMAGVAYDFVNEELDGNFGATLEFGIFFRVSLNVNLLWIIHGSWELYSKRFPAMKLGYQYDIKDRTSSDTIELNKYETDIFDTNLLTFNAFDGTGLMVVTKTYKYNDKVKYFEASNGKNASYKLFEVIKTDSNDVTISDGKIVVKDGIAETRGQIYIRVRTTPFTTRDYYVNYHFVASNVKYVTVDGQNKTAYLPGQKVVLPTENLKRTGYVFKGWDYNGKLISTLDELYMEDNDINLKSVYVVDEIHIVRFYDGLNNLISSQEVRNYESAIEPTKDLRDKNMDGYIFVGWDKKFDEVTEDLDVYAIYERGGDL